MPRTPDETPHETKPGWTLIKRDYPRGVDRAISFYRREHTFCFVLERWFGPFVEDDGTSLNDAYWSQDGASGLFGRLEDAEREAYRILKLSDDR